MTTESLVQSNSFNSTPGNLHNSAFRQPLVTPKRSWLQMRIFFHTNLPTGFMRYILYMAIKTEKLWITFEFQGWNCCELHLQSNWKNKGDSFCSSCARSVFALKLNVLIFFLSTNSNKSQFSWRKPTCLSCACLEQHWKVNNTKPTKRCQSLVWQISYDIRSLPFLEERLRRLVWNLSQWRADCSFPFCKNVFRWQFVAKIK